MISVSQVSIRARLGLAGATRDGRLAPLTVDVDSDTATGPAVVRYDPKGTVSTQAIELSPGTRKRCTLLVEKPVRGARVTVCRPDGEQLVSVEPAPHDVLGDGELLVLVIARAEQHHAPPGLAGLSLDTGSTRQALRSAVRFVAAGDLPEHWAAFSAADVVMVGDDDLERAAPGSVAALLDWTVRGGSLFVVGGVRPARLAGTPLPGVLPVELTGRTVTLDRLDGLDAAFPGGTAASTGGAGLPLASLEGIRVREPFVVPEARARPGARVLVAERGLQGPVPLVVRGPLGDGTVTYLALDLERSPLTYTGRVACLRMWRALLPRPDLTAESDYNPYGRTHPFELARGRVRVEPAAGALGVQVATSRTPWLVGLFVVCYWLVVGPVQYLVLRRRRALHLVWVVTPLVAILFSVMAFGLGYLRRGGGTLARELVVVHGRAGDLAMAADSLVRIHAFTELGYTVRGPAGRSVAMPLSRDHHEEITLSCGAPEVAAAGVTVPMWSDRTFWTSFPAPAVEVEARLEVVTEEPSALPGPGSTAPASTAGAPATAGSGNRVRGTITVRGQRLRNARLQLGSFHAIVGDLEPGKPRAVDESLLIVTRAGDEPWRGSRGRWKRMDLLTLESDPEWWQEMGCGGPEHRLELVGLVDERAVASSRVEPAVAVHERRVVAIVELPYRQVGAVEVTVKPGYSHRRTVTDPDLSISQLALSGPTPFQVQLFPFPRPRLVVRDLTLVLSRDDRMSANVLLRHPVRGTWDQVFSAASPPAPSHWRDAMIRLDVPSGHEYVRMPEGIVEVRLDPAHGAVAAGSVSRVDFEVRGMESDPEAMR